MAVITNQEDIVQKLIDAGANLDQYLHRYPDHRYHENRKPQATALQMGIRIGSAIVVRRLIQGGADLNAKAHCWGQGTPLCEAVWKGDLDIAQLLIKKDTDLHASSSEAYKPHYLPAFRHDGRQRIKGNKPMEIAQSRGYREIEKLLLENNVPI